MGGGLMQLVAYGAQDIYLTGNPQITFFKVVYRRHTNFSMETIQQTINGASTLTDTEGSGSVTISRNGDLVHKVYVSVTNAGVINGSKIVKYAELEIGGQRIDKHTSAWNEAWNELSTPESKAIGLKSMQSCIGTSGTIPPTHTVISNEINQVQVPLNFWFCRNPGLALPLIALQYHEVKIKFVWGAFSDVGTATGASCVVMADYIYLDTDERRRFAQVSHEYLIEQLQEQSGTTPSDGRALSMKLNFNHPVKELIWTLPSDVKMNEVVLKLNGHERFSKQSDDYFTLRQPFDYHTSVPRQNLPLAARKVTRILDNQSPTVLLDPTTYARSSNDVTTINFAAGDLDTLGAMVVGDVVLLTVTAADTAVGLGSGSNGSEVGTSFIASLTAAYATGTGTSITFANGAQSSIITANTKLTAHGDSAHASDKIVVSKLSNGTFNSARTSKATDRIGVYSFALKPEEHQPSGTCNFSRIDNAVLSGTTTKNGTSVTVYAVNYNVLRIMSGMGGLAYSN